MKLDRWPCWIQLRYYSRTTGREIGYTLSASNEDVLFDQLDRVKLRQSDIIRFEVDGEILNDDEITSIYNWLIKKRMERKADEERAKAKQKAEDSNASGKTKSR